MCLTDPKKVQHLQERAGVGGDGVGDMGLVP